MRRISNIFNASECFGIMSSVVEGEKNSAEGIGKEVSDEVCITFDNASQKYCVFDNRHEDPVSYGPYDYPEDAFQVYVDVCTSDYKYSEKLKNLFLDKYIEEEWLCLYYLDGYEPDYCS